MWSINLTQEIADRDNLTLISSDKLTTYCAQCAETRSQTATTRAAQQTNPETK